MIIPKAINKMIYEQGPAIQVVKKPSQYQSQQEATSNAPNLDIDSQIDQATQNIQSAGN